MEGHNIDITRIDQRIPPRYNVTVDGKCVARGITIEEVIEIVNATECA